jgi:hypothetical protein
MPPAAAKKIGRLFANEWPWWLDEFGDERAFQLPAAVEYYRDIARHSLDLPPLARDAKDLNPAKVRRTGIGGPAIHT